MPRDIFRHQSKCALLRHRRAQVDCRVTGQILERISKNTLTDHAEADQNPGQRLVVAALCTQRPLQLLIADQPGRQQTLDQRSVRFCMPHGTYRRYRHLPVSFECREEAAPLNDAGRGATYPVSAVRTST